MPPTPTRVDRARVRTAERRGPDRPSEDRIFTTDNAVIVLDGASQPHSGGRDGGWYADTLGQALRQMLQEEPTGDLGSQLERAIHRVASGHGLRPGESPSATVSILRWTDCVDALVLGDSPIIALTSEGRVRQVRDERLRGVARDQRRQLAEIGGFASAARDQWSQLISAERSARNRPGGYWIAEATPEAATQAFRACWPFQEITTALVMTDGVSAGVDRYRAPADWPSAFRVAQRSPTDLIELVHSTEATDPDGVRWRRSKRHDDKAVALVEFSPAALPLLPNDLA
jgi:hypothetical protein